jgi:hypothetical protein
VSVRKRQSFGSAQLSFFFDLTAIVTTKASLLQNQNMRYPRV